MAISGEECRRMTVHHRCMHRDLFESSEIWRTKNLPAFSFPSAPFGCCTSFSAAVTNCFFYPTTVHTRHSDASPQTPAGDASECTSEGLCSLADGPVLIWSPDKEERIRFRKANARTPKEYLVQCR
uniref:Ig-like domain-containing protein n=1 Tax=Haemonchus placei TaxID=6290 RepID=A0A158QMV1_HAEPC